MNATRLLKKDHDTVKELFRKFEKMKEEGSKGKQDVVQEIDRELEIHATVEEEIFYPAVKRARTEETKDIVLEALEEHHVVKTLLKELKDMSPKDESYDAKVTVLIENVEHHIKEEEGEMFPDAKKFLSEEQLEALGAKMEGRKEVLLEKFAETSHSKK